MKKKAGKSGNTTAYKGGTAYKRLSAPTEGKKESNPEPTDKKAPVLTDHINENEGFGGWLTSDDGASTMKMFVMANSVVMLITVGLPYIYQLLNYLHDARDQTPVRLY